MLAEACAGLGVQLVITLGGRGRPEAYTRLAGDPVVVAYAPQLDILKRAAVTVCHAGNNTILESLSCGVPALAVPFNTDQYSIASRLRQSGAGESVTLSKLTPARVHRILEWILSRPEYAARAGVMRDSIERAGGTRRAADFVESALAGRLDRGLPRALTADSLSVLQKRQGTSPRNTHPSLRVGGRRTPLNRES